MIAAYIYLVGSVLYFSGAFLFLAELVVQRLEEYDAALKAKIEKSIKEAEAKAASEIGKVGTVMSNNNNDDAGTV